MTKLGTILDQIDAGSVLLPEFQRGYVWNRDQVRGLMRSLYLDYPVGSLLVWETDGAEQAVRGGQADAGRKQLLLDGQQRITTLYGIVRGRPPSFFDGDPAAFTGLHFHVGTETFEFTGPVKAKADPRWVDVTALFVEGPQALGPRLYAHADAADSMWNWIARLEKLRSVLVRDFHVEAITGADKTVDVVIDIFNRVNSGGTKLSKGDLALARLCAGWPGARPALRQELQRWTERGFAFTPDWLLRNVGAVVTGRAPITSLDGVDPGAFEDGLHKTRHNVDHLLEILSGRLGLDHDRVLAGRYAFPVLSRLLHAGGGKFAGEREADRALFWYVHAALQGRYSAAGETVLARDLQIADTDGVDGLLDTLSHTTVEARHFEGAGRGSRAYPMLYLVSRVAGAPDLVSGRPVDATGTPVEVHEIFPRSELVEAGHARTDGNAVANVVFLPPASAAELAGRPPRDYLTRCHPDLLAAQWIPAEPRLWEPENYREFLAARRELLAAALGEFLTALLEGRAPWRWLRAIEVNPEPVLSGEPDPGADQLAALLDELSRLGYAAPDPDTEITDPATGVVLASVTASWRDGLQHGQGPGVVLDLDPQQPDHPRLATLGITVFRSIDALREYATERSAAAAGPVPAVDLTPASEGAVAARSADAAGSGRAADSGRPADATAGGRSADADGGRSVDATDGGRSTGADGGHSADATATGRSADADGGGSVDATDGGRSTGAVDSELPADAADPGRSAGAVDRVRSTDVDRVRSTDVGRGRPGDVASGRSADAVPAGSAPSAADVDPAASVDVAGSASPAEPADEPASPSSPLPGADGPDRVEPSTGEGAGREPDARPQALVVRRDGDSPRRGGSTRSAPHEVPEPAELGATGRAEPPAPATGSPGETDSPAVLDLAEPGRHNLLPDGAGASDPGLRGSGASGPDPAGADEPGDVAEAGSVGDRLPRRVPRERAGKAIGRAFAPDTPPAADDAEAAPSVSANGDGRSPGEQAGGALPRREPRGDVPEPAGGFEPSNGALPRRDPRGGVPDLAGGSEPSNGALPQREPRIDAPEPASGLESSNGALPPREPRGDVSFGDSNGALPRRRPSGAGTSGGELPRRGSRAEAPDRGEVGAGGALPRRASEAVSADRAGAPDSRNEPAPPWERVAGSGSDSPFGGNLPRRRLREEAPDEPLPRRGTTAGDGGAPLPRREPRAASAGSLDREPQPGKPGSFDREPRTGEQASFGREPRAGEPGASGRGPQAGELASFGRGPRTGEPGAFGREPKAGELASFGRGPNAGEPDSLGRDQQPGQPEPFRAGAPGSSSTEPHADEPTLAGAEQEVPDSVRALRPDGLPLPRRVPRRNLGEDGPGQGAAPGGPVSRQESPVAADPDGVPPVEPLPRTTTDPGRAAESAHPVPDETGGVPFAGDVPRQDAGPQAGGNPLPRRTPRANGDVLFGGRSGPRPGEPALFEPAAPAPVEQPISTPFPIRTLDRLGLDQPLLERLGLGPSAVPGPAGGSVPVGPALNPAVVQQGAPDGRRTSNGFVPGRPAAQNGVPDGSAPDHAVPGRPLPDHSTSGRSSGERRLPANGSTADRPPVTWQAPDRPFGTEQAPDRSLPQRRPAPDRPGGERPLGERPADMPPAAEAPTLNQRAAPERAAIDQPTGARPPVSARRSVRRRPPAEAALPSPDSPLAQEFTSAVHDARRQATAELGHEGERVHDAVERLGAVGAARAVLAEPVPGDAFVFLFDRRKLGLSLEALVSEERFAPLFTEAERGTALRRLEQYGWSPSAA